MNEFLRLCRGCNTFLAIQQYGEIKWMYWTNDVCSMISSGIVLLPPIQPNMLLIIMVHERRILFLSYQYNETPTVSAGILYCNLELNRGEIQDYP